jgi:hypothetical protein
MYSFNKVNYEQMTPDQVNFVDNSHVLVAFKRDNKWLDDSTQIGLFLLVKIYNG